MMAKYLVSRMTQAVFTILGISIVVFLLARLSGDAAALLIPSEASAADREALRQQLGLDRPLLLQYWLFLQGALTLDFCNSFGSENRLWNVYLERFPNTASLGLCAALITAGGGVLIGVYGAVKAGSRSIAQRTFWLMGQAAPSFAIAILMIAVFSVTLGWLPTSGMNH